MNIQFHNGFLHQEVQLIAEFKPKLINEMIVNLSSIIIFKLYPRYYVSMYVKQVIY